MSDSHNFERLLVVHFVRRRRVRIKYVLDRCRRDFQPNLAVMPTRLAPSGFVTCG